MRKQKQKYYTVWEGHNPGVYDTWEECRKQTSGFPQAKYKSFPSFSEAKKALEQGVPEDYYKKNPELNDNIVEVIFAKHRSGAVGTVKLAFRKEISRFENLVNVPESAHIPDV